MSSGSELSEAELSDDEGVLWIHSGREVDFYMTPQHIKRVAEPCSLDVMVFQNKDDYFIAVAPEWASAMGFGETADAALRELTEKLSFAREAAVEEKNGADLRRIPVNPSMETARKWCEEVEREFYEELKREATGRFWWDSIKV